MSEKELLESDIYKDAVVEATRVLTEVYGKKPRLDVAENVAKRLTTSILAALRPSRKIVPSFPPAPQNVLIRESESKVRRKSIVQPS